MLFLRNKETGEMLHHDVIIAPENKDKYEPCYDYHLGNLEQINERLGWILFLIVTQIVAGGIAAYFFF